MYGEGISKEGTLLDIAVAMDLIKKSGAWFAYNGTRVAQGRENAKKYLRENPAVYQEIDKIIRDTLMAEPQKFEDGVIAANDDDEAPAVEANEEK